MVTPSPLTVLPERTPVPLTAGALLRGAWGAWSRQWVLYGAFGLVQLVTVLAVTRVLRSLVAEPLTTALRGLVVVVALCVASLGGVTQAMDDERNGRPVRVRAVLVAGLRHLVPLGVVLFPGVAALAGGLIGLRALGMALWGVDADGWVTVVALLAACLAGVLLGGLLLAFAPAVVVERRRPLAALRVGWSRMRGHRSPAVAANLVVSACWLAGPTLLLAGSLAFEVETVVAAPMFWGLFFCVPLPWLLPAVAHDLLLRGEGGLRGEELRRIFE